MGSLPVIGWQPLSDTGAIMSGAKAYFYRTGTATPKNTYSNKGLTSANANPVVADAYGRFGDVFLLKDEGYRCVLKTSADVTIYTEDEVFASSLAVDEQTRRIAIARSPIDNSAVGDGVTDDAVALQAAITAAGTGVLDLEGKTYRCDSALSLQSGVTVRNGTLDFSACNADDFLLAQGTQGANLLFSGNEDEQQTVLSMAATTGLAAGDLVLLHEQSDLDMGELAILASVSAGVSVTTTLGVVGTYTTADLASIAEITPVTGVRLENLKIIGNTAASGAGNAVTLDKCKGAKLRNVEVTAAKGYGFNVLRSYDVQLSGCRVAGTSFGLRVGQASARVRVSRCSIDAGIVVVGEVTASAVCGITHGVVFDSCVFSDDINFTELSRSVTLSASEFHATTNGKNLYLKGQDLTVTGCRLFNARVSIVPTVPVPARPTGIAITNNQIHATGGTGAIAVDLSSGSMVLGGVVVSGNYIYSNTDDAFVVDASGGGVIRGIAIVGNVFQTSAGSLFSVSGAGAATIDRCVIANNTQETGGLGVECSGGAVFTSLEITGNTLDGAIQFSGSSVSITRGVIRGNIIEDSTTTGISVLNATDLVVADNVVSGTFTTSGISVAGAAGGTRAAVSGNSVTGVAGTNVIGISVVNYDEATIAGNRVGASGEAIDFGISAVNTAASANLVIANNTINGIANTANNAAIRVNGASGQRLTNCVISGNVIDTPEFAIRCVGYVDQLSITGNAINHTDSSGTQAAISLDGTAAGGLTHVAITGNAIKSGSRCITIESYCEAATITGNTLEGATTTNSVVLLSGDAASAVNNFTVCGNAIREGVYGIETANTALGIHDGNSFYSQSTAITTGTITAGDSV